MSTERRSELGCLQGEADRCPPCSADTEAPVEVKKHQHKHNLKHRYEVMETLGRGTYGKVKKAVEKASMRTVSPARELRLNYDILDKYCRER